MTPSAPNALQAALLTRRRQDNCGYVIGLPPQQRCRFVNESADCVEFVIIFNYMNYATCVVPWLPVGIGVLVLWALLMMMLLVVSSRIT